MLSLLGGEAKNVALLQPSWSFYKSHRADHVFPCSHPSSHEHLSQSYSFEVWPHPWNCCYSHFLYLLLQAFISFFFLSPVLQVYGERPNNSKLQGPRSTKRNDWERVLKVRSIGREYPTPLELGAKWEALEADNKAQRAISFPPIRFLNLKVLLQALRGNWGATELTLIYTSQHQFHTFQRHGWDSGVIVN